MPPTTEPLCLLSVHAHPDDEASKGAGTVARYRDEGVRTVLVCCTGGEEGDILNPAMDRPEVRERLPEVRREELEASTKIIGYDEVILLGYRDSGMPDTEANARPEAFANAPLDESAGRLVAIIRRARPQVIITYGDDQSGYPHPDHLRVHDISVAAFDRAGDPDWYPELGEPCQPVEALLLGLVDPAHEGDAREDARAGHRVAVRREVVRAPVAGPPHHHPGRRRRAGPACGVRPCWPTPPRSTRRRRSGSACPTTWPTACSRHEDYVRARSRGRRAAPRGRPLRRSSLTDRSHDRTVRTPAPARRAGGPGDGRRRRAPGRADRDPDW